MVVNKNSQKRAGSTMSSGTSSTSYHPGHIINKVRVGQSPEGGAPHVIRLPGGPRGFPGCAPPAPFCPPGYYPTCSPYYPYPPPPWASSYPPAPGVPPPPYGLPPPPSSIFPPPFSPAMNFPPSGSGPSGAPGGLHGGRGKQIFRVPRGSPPPGFPGADSGGPQPSYNNCNFYGNDHPKGPGQQDGENGASPSSASFHPGGFLPSRGFQPPPPGTRPYPGFHSRQGFQPPPYYPSMRPPAPNCTGMEGNLVGGGGGDDTDLEMLIKRMGGARYLASGKPGICQNIDTNSIDDFFDDLNLVEADSLKSFLRDRQNRRKAADGGKRHRKSSVAKSTITEESQKA